MQDSLLAAVEAGGTKFLCVVTTEAGEVLAQERFATGAPDETFAAVASFYERQRMTMGPVAAAGLASFGPLDLDPSSGGYGQLTTTPKPGWSGIDVRGRLAAITGAPTAIETDVNAAGIAEARGGAGQGLGRFCYVTVGTGIGIGVIEGGHPLAGIGHSEAGHMVVRRDPRDGFAGACPFHGDCLEGLASGPAIAARWGRSGDHLAADHLAWDVEATYLAAMCVNLSYLLRPERIVLGGGVMAQASLLDRVRERFTVLAAGYALDRCSAEPATFICPPVAQDPSPGLIGAVELARALLPAPHEG